MPKGQVNPREDETIRLRGRKEVGPHVARTTQPVDKAIFGWAVAGGPRHPSASWRALGIGSLVADTDDEPFLFGAIRGPSG